MLSNNYELDMLVENYKFKKIEKSRKFRAAKIREILCQNELGRAAVKYLEILEKYSPECAEVNTIENLVPYNTLSSNIKEQIDAVQKADSEELKQLDNKILEVKALLKEASNLNEVNTILVKYDIIEDKLNKKK